MTREDEIRARLDVLPWTSWATVDKDDLRWLLAERNHWRKVAAQRGDDYAEHIDRCAAAISEFVPRAEQAEAKVARVERVAIKWSCPPLENPGNTLVLRDLRDALRGDA